MRLIDAERLTIKGDLSKPIEWDLGVLHVLNLIYHAPVIDAVEVLRCKDCWHYNTDKGYCGFWGEERPEKHFCAEGIRERREQ